MKFSRIFITLSFLIFILCGYAFGPVINNLHFSSRSKVYAENTEKQTNKKSTLSENEDPRLIPVTGIILFAWLGIALFLLRIQWKVKKLEDEINEQ